MKNLLPSKNSAFNLPWWYVLLVGLIMQIYILYIWKHSDAAIECNNYCIKNHYDYGVIYAKKYDFSETSSCKCYMEKTNNL